MRGKQAPVVRAGPPPPGASCKGGGLCGVGRGREEARGGGGRGGRQEAAEEARGGGRRRRRQEAAEEAGGRGLPWPPVAPLSLPFSRSLSPFPARLPFGPRSLSARAPSRPRPSRRALLRRRPARLPGVSPFLRRLRPPALS